MLYPLAKRLTDCPEVVLGFPMAWGIFMGSVAMGADPLQLSVTLLRSRAHDIGTHYQRGPCITRMCSGRCFMK